jgi:hypothetical protein
MARAILSVPADRGYAGFTAVTIGQTCAAVSVGAAALGGNYLAPFALPASVDVSYPIDVYAWLAPAANSLVDGQHVMLGVRRTNLTRARNWGDSTVNYKWPIPNAWLTTQPERVLLDDGTGHTFQAHTFTEGDLLGLRISRNGGDPLDTFAHSLLIADALELGYTSRCKANCCP